MAYIFCCMRASDGVPVRTFLDCFLGARGSPRPILAVCWAQGRVGQAGSPTQIREHKGITMVDVSSLPKPWVEEDKLGH